MLLKIMRQLAACSQVLLQDVAGEAISLHNELKLQSRKGNENLDCIIFPLNSRTKTRLALNVIKTEDETYAQ